MSTPLPSQRDHFDIPDGITYLNCAYMSPLLRSVCAAGEAGVRRKARPWQLRPADFFGESEELRTLFARLIGGDADGIAIIPSVSYAMAIAAANLPSAPGRRILMLADQFPSNVYPWQDLARRTGATVVTIPRPPDHDWTAAVLAAIDERVAIVAVPNCHWTDGGLLDLAHIGHACRAAGAALVVDATQSLGAHPLDVGSIQPDFMVAAAYKWLLGPYGLAFMYVAPRHRKGIPLEHNWLNREGSEDFRGLVDYREGFQPGARRYDMGERSNPILLPMAAVALRQLLDWGVPAIGRTLAALTLVAERGAHALGFDATPADRRAGHMIGLRIPATIAADLDARLAAANVFVSMRGSSMRVSPHLYNTPGDIERLLEVLRSAIGG